MPDLQQTVLHDWHVAHGAKMVAFADYSMPLNYAMGIVKEHLWVREHAGMFDVSHMGQILLQGEALAEQLETMLPIDAQTLSIGQQRYALLTNERGTIDDDLMVTRRAKDFYLVVNAACKKADFAKIDAALHDVAVDWWADRALFALQGPEAHDVLRALNADVVGLDFMHGMECELLGESCWVSRSGYTGEDGFELSVPNRIACDLADRLLADERVKPIGLGARDSLRLEAGLCLYGHELSTETTPIEAGLLWSIQKVRRPDGARAGHYPGSTVIGAQIEQGVTRKLVGLKESCWVSRSGYTGEDGFELSVPNRIACDLADRLLADERVKPIGLGARDSLRLEAGLCLYGHELSTETTPIEAGLLWSIQKVRRPDGARAGHYPGSTVIGAQIEQGVTRKLVGLKVRGRVPVRDGATLIDADGRQIGLVTSGGFGPSVNAPIAMAYIEQSVADSGAAVFASVRHRMIEVDIVALPFIPKGYKK